MRPALLRPGERQRLEILGRGFACGAAVRISGGGILALDEPKLIPGDSDAGVVILSWSLEVEEGAQPGFRSLTVSNPNGSEQSLPAAFEVEDLSASGEQEAAFCSLGRGSTAPWLLLLLFLPLLLQPPRSSS